MEKYYLIETPYDHPQFPDVILTSWHAVMKHFDVYGHDIGADECDDDGRYYKDHFILPITENQIKDFPDADLITEY